MTGKLKSKSVFLGYVFAAGATAIWSGNFIVARGLNDTIPPVSLAFFRWLTAVVVLMPFALKNMMHERHVIKKHLLYFCITAVLGITTFNTLIYIAGHTTTALNLSMIAITFPIFIILFSRILYNEKIPVKRGFGIFLVLVGVLFLLTRGKPNKLLEISFNIGDLWMLTAAVIFATYSLFLKNKPEEISIKALQMSTFMIGLVFLFPFYVWEAAVLPAPAFTPTAVGAILYIGIFASLCAFMLWNNAIMILGPSKAGMVYYTLPLFCGLSGYLFLNESVKMLHLYCMVLILTGIGITNQEPKENELKKINTWRRKGRRAGSTKKNELVG